jgi:membrane protease YdiL (CAAX protease family)
LVPPVAGTVLSLVLPWAPPPQPAVVRDPRRLRLSTLLLLIIAIVFPVVVGVPGVASSGWYLLAKVALLTVAAGLAVALLRGVGLDRATGAWRWWAPIAVVAVWAALGPAAPWAAPADFSGIEPVDLVLIAVLTALTAGVGEELFYRRWLQTRVEALLGPWAGIILTSVAFALMHLGSHGTGEPLIDIPRLLVTHGSFGLFMGVLWWRYRNLTLIIAAHILYNGWSVGEHLILG